MTADRYVDLSRRFVDFHASDITTLTMRRLGSCADQVTVGWDDILRSRCAVVLGEPGCGKTTESKAKVASVRASGGYAFHRTVTDLGRLGAPLVQMPDRPALDAWRASRVEGLFVLDSLDEARTGGGSLEAAVDRLNSELRAEWNRVRVVLTCRVAEWSSEEDLQALAGYFNVSASPEPAVGDAAPTSVSEAATARRHRTVAPAGPVAPPVRVVRMAVLSEDQAMDLAGAMRIRNLQGLRAAVRRAGAWALLERPADVTWLVNSWNRRGSLGTLTELMEDNVASRLEEHGPSRRRRSELSAEAAARGIRELALVGVLCGERRVRLSSNDAPETALEPAAALPWMRPRELAELTERAILVDDGPGARRLHHRATEEYLAARAVFDLLGQQAGGRALANFCVRERYGRRVVPPSLRGVAAWAAGWDDALRRAILDADPSLLLQAGDPAAIAPGERRGVLERILEDANEHPWRRDGADHSDLARFACPELSDLVGDRLRRPQLRGADLLLRLVWHGRLAGNAEDALRLAADRRTPYDLRELAVRAAAAAGDVGMRERIVALVSTGARPMVDELFAAAEELYPESMSAGQLGRGVVAWARAGLRASRSESAHLSWLLDRAYDARRHEELAAVLGPALLRLARAIPARSARAGVAAVRLASALRVVLMRRMRDGPPGPSTLDAWAPWLWALARVHEASDALGELNRGVAELTGQEPVRRAILRWLLRNRVPHGATNLTSPFELFKQEPFDLWRAVRGDSAWIVEELRTAKRPAARAVWFGLACASCAGREEVTAVEAVAEAYPELADELRRRREWRAAPADPGEEELRRREAEIKEERAARERKNREDLLSLVDEVRKGTHAGALRLLVGRMEDVGHSRWGHSDWRSLAAPFGDEVAEAAREGLKRAWRRYRPTLPHERVKPNEVEWFVPVGLTGLNLAFADGLVPGELSEHDVERATAYALCEMNVFPEWFGALAEGRPEAVLRVLVPVLEAEYLGTAASSARELLGNLGHRDARVRRLVTPTLVRLLDSHVPADAHVLDRALTALDEDAPARQALLPLAKARAGLDGNEQAAMWWRCLSGLDPASAAAILRDAARGGAPRHTLVDAVDSVDWRAAGLDVLALADVVRSTYRAVAPSEDLRRPAGVVYSPGPRDGAERRRSGLVGHLADVPGEETFRSLLGLADDPAIGAHADWLKHLAHTRCERDAEPAAMSVSQARAFLEAPEGRFADSDGFFAYSLDRLDDLRASVEGGDFSCRSLLRIADEPGIQRFVAHSLRLTTVGRCSVVREEEVDRLKKPDIRLHAVRPNAVVGVEIKVADSWTLPQLEAALEQQLVGQYLRDARSRHGVLLLLHSGKKQGWECAKRRLTFEEVVDHLVGRGRDLGQKSSVQVRVVAIDCRGAPPQGAAR